MLKKITIHILFLYLFTFSIFSEEASESKTTKEQKKDPKEEVISTLHSIQIGGVDVSYKATVGTQPLNDEKGNTKASVFYIAYTKEGIENSKERPVTFCFNGGPGSASVWLHLGVFGPKRIDIDEEGKVAKQPFQLVDNPYSLLDITDLVFIDPVSTGYSRAAPGEDAKQFHGVDSDVQSVAEFIRLYVTRNERWESAKFLAGESYGTTRAAGLAQELHDKHHLFLDGILLLSCVLNFQTIKFVSGNDLPYILFLPTYTATSLYHHRLPEDLQKDKKKTLEEVENFAYGDYASALMQGDHLNSDKRKEVLDKLVRYTGLSKEFIDSENLRINIFRFAKQLLRTEKRTIGRFDSRLKGIDTDVCGDVFEFDPSFENIIGVFTATFNDYVRRDLNWKRDDEYRILANVSPWDYGDATNQYLDVGEKLKNVMSKNVGLEVFVASGYYDLATPYFATDYTFTHLGLDPSLEDNLILKTYEGGHMMYLYHPTLVKLKSDLSNFMQKKLEKRTLDFNKS